MAIRFIRALLFGLLLFAVGMRRYPPHRSRRSASRSRSARPAARVRAASLSRRRYIWTPGYWAYDYDYGDYYWVPGTWVMVPEVGCSGPQAIGVGRRKFCFYEGYWGPRIGFYGGINYGYGYFGEGYEGGRWTMDASSTTVR